MILFVCLIRERRNSKGEKDTTGKSMQAQDRQQTAQEKKRGKR